jgi:RNA polymerase-binding transcription factor DksA
MEVISMSANFKVHLIEIPVGGNGGLVWNRLHSEREDICEAMLKDSQMHKKPADTSTKNWHRELLQARLRKVDDALDRLMAGSYGNCSKCGKGIEDTKLDFDSAIAFCVGCWELESRKYRGPGLTQGAPTAESVETITAAIH